MLPIYKILLIISLFHSTLPLRFPIYQYNSSIVIDPPGPPSCSNQKDHVKTISMPTSLWFVDTQKTEMFGLLIWTEFYQTSCFTNFWGSESRLVLQNYIASTIFPETHTLETLLITIPPSKIIPISPFAEYQCSWMSTNIKESTVTFVKKVPIYYTSIGTLYSSSFEWTNQVNNYTYQNDNYYLYGHFHGDKCPPLIKHTYPSIIRIHENFYYVTIPSLHIQLNVIPNSTHLYCTLSTDKILMTPDNYLISVPDLNITYMKKALETINIEYKWSRLLFDLNNVEEMIEEELQYLEHEICFNRKLIWNQVFYSQNPTMIARYFTGNNWIKGQFIDDGKILTHLPSILDDKCSLPTIKTIKNNTMKVTCQHLGDTYITPWTNSINGPISHKMGYWLFISEGTYINYQTGQVQITAKFNDLGKWQYKSFNVHEFSNYLKYQPGDKSLHKIVHMSESIVSEPFSWSTITSWISHLQMKIIWGIISIVTIIYIIKIVLKSCCQYKKHKTRY